MKPIAILIILFLLNLFSYGQQHPNRISDEPDGITVAYFNTAGDTCQPEIFICDTLQMLFPCRHNRSVDISSATFEIARLKQLVTFDLLRQIIKCCGEKKCPDTIHGYMLRIKKGNEEETVSLDINFIGKATCGSSELIEIIQFLNKINETYH